MEANMDERLEQAVTALGDLIERIRSGDHGQSVFFLQMAMLQLKLDLHGITDEEFGALCEALENGRLEPDTLARPGQPRARPGGDQRGPGRARPCANDIAMRRVGRRH